MRRSRIVTVVALAMVSVGAVVAVALTLRSSDVEQPVLVPSQEPAAAWVTDGEVDDVVQAGGSVFVAGSFTRVARWTGGLAWTNRSTGTLEVGGPSLEGTVTTIASDGSGGWFVGGSFKTSRQADCPNLVHVLRKGGIAPGFCARLDTVRLIAVAGGRLYVVGEDRDELVALDPRTGRALDWTLKADGGYDDAQDQGRNSTDPAFHALASDGTTLYVGGFFDAVGDQPRTHIAALDGRNGELLPWNARIAAAGDADPTDLATDEGSPFPRAHVATLAVSGEYLYAGGSFDRVDGAPRSSLAAFDLANRELTAWAPYAQSLSGGVQALTAVDDGVAVAAGHFGDANRTTILSLEPAPGLAVVRWAIAADAGVRDLALDEDNTLVVGGGFSIIGGAPRSGAAMLSANGRVTGWNPAPTAEVSAVRIVADGVLVGGSFAGVGGQARDGLAAFNALSGALDPWAPIVDEVAYADPDDAGSVYWSLAASDRFVYVFGDFVAVDGAPRNRLAAFDLTDIHLTPWSPNLVRRGPIYDAQIAADDEAAYVSYWHWTGDHDDVTPSLTAIETNGSARWKTPNSWDVDVNAMVVAGDQLWLGGDSEPYLQSVDVDTGEPATSDPPRFASRGYDHPWIDALAASANVVYASGTFDAVDGEARPGVAAFNGTTLTEWAPQLTGESEIDSTGSVAASAGVVYTTGDTLSFEAVAGKPRPGLAAVTSDTAEPIDWPRVDLFPDGGLADAGPEAVVVVGGYRDSPSPSIAIFQLRPAGGQD